MNLQQRIEHAERERIQRASEPRILPEADCQLAEQIAHSQGVSIDRAIVEAVRLHGILNTLPEQSPSYES